MKKRLLSLLLASALIISLFPTRIIFAEQQQQGTYRYQIDPNTEYSPNIGNGYVVFNPTLAEDPELTRDLFSASYYRKGISANHLYCQTLRTLIKENTMPTRIHANAASRYQLLPKICGQPRFTKGDMQLGFMMRCENDLDHWSLKHGLDSRQDSWGLFRLFGTDYAEEAIGGSVVSLGFMDVKNRAVKWTPYTYQHMAMFQMADFWPSPLPISQFLGIFSTGSCPWGDVNFTDVSALLLDTVGPKVERVEVSQFDTLDRWGLPPTVRHEFSAGEVVYFHVIFDEAIRFADNLPEKDKVLLIKRKAADTMTEMGDPLEATFWRIDPWDENDMVFRLQIPEASDETFYFAADSLEPWTKQTHLYGKDSNGVGKFYDDNPIFNFVSTQEKRDAMRKKARVESAIVDLAGNPVRNVGIPFFEKAVMDNTVPNIEYCDISVSRADQDSAANSKVYIREGDTIHLTVVFDERIGAKYIRPMLPSYLPGDVVPLHLSLVDHKAELNIVHWNGTPVEAKLVSAVDEPFSTRDNRLVTRLHFEYTLQKGDRLEGEQIGVNKIWMESITNFEFDDMIYSDRCGNSFAGETDGHSINLPATVYGKQQYQLDNDAPAVTNTQKTVTEEKLFFVNALTVNDGSGSGILGADGTVTVSTSYRGHPTDQKIRWAVKNALDNPPAEEEYIDGNTTNHPFTVPLLGEEMNLYVYLSGTSSVDSVDISFQAADRTGNLSSSAKTTAVLSKPIDLSGPEVISFSRKITLAEENKQQLVLVAEDPAGIMDFEYQFGDAVSEDAWISLSKDLAIRPDRYTATIDVPAFAPEQETMTLWVRMQDTQEIFSSVQQFAVENIPDGADVGVEIDAEPMSLSEARGSYKIDTTFQNTNAAYFYWTYIDEAGQEHPLADYLAQQNLPTVDYNWVAGIVIPENFDTRHGFPDTPDLVGKLHANLAAACGPGQERYRTIYRPMANSVLDMGPNQSKTMTELYGRFALHMTSYKLPQTKNEYGQPIEGGDVIATSRTFTMNLLGDEAAKNLQCNIFGQYDNNGRLSQMISDSQNVSLNMENNANNYMAEIRISSPFPGVGIGQILDAERSTVNLVDLYTGKVMQKIPVEAVDLQVLRFPMEPGKAYTLQPEFYILGGQKAVEISDFPGKNAIIQISDLIPRQSGLTGFSVYEIDPDYGGALSSHPLGDGSILHSTMALSGTNLPTVVDHDDSLYLNMQIRTETDRTDDVIPYGFVKVWSDYTTRLHDEVKFPEGSMHDVVGTREKPFVMSSNELSYGNMVDQPTGSAATLGDQTLLLPVFYANGMTDEEVVLTGMDYANHALPLLDGRNSFYYQIVLSNGTESEVRTFDILVDSIAPQASVSMQNSTAPAPTGGDDTIKTVKPVIDYIMDNVSMPNEMKITEQGYAADGTPLQPNDPDIDTTAADYNILRQGSGYLFTAPGKYVLTVSDASGNTITVEKTMTDVDFDAQAPNIDVQVEPQSDKGDVEFTVSVSDNGVTSGEVPFALTFNDAYMAQLGRTEIFPLNSELNTPGVSFPGLVSIERLSDNTYHVVMDACYNPAGPDSNLTALIFQAEDPSGNVAVKEVPVTVANEKPAVVRHYYSASDGYTVEFNKTVRLGEQTRQPYTYGRTLSGLLVTENGDYDVEFIDLFAKAYHETIQADLYPIEYAHKMTISEKKATNQDVIVTFDTTENPAVTVAVTPSDAIDIVKTSETVTTVTVKKNTRLVYTLKVEGLSDLERTLPISNIDKTAPTAQVEYIYEAPVLNGKTEGYVTAALVNPSEPITVTSDSGMTHLFMEKGTYTFTFEDAAGNQGSVTASVDAEIDKKLTPEDQDAPGYTLRLYRYNEEGYCKIGSFTEKTYTPDALAAYPPSSGKLVLEFLPDDVNPVTVTVQETGKPVIVQDHRIFVLENTSFHVDLTDSCGNKTTLEIRVPMIDNEAPTGTVRYMQASNGSMRAYLDLKDNMSKPEDIQILSREGITDDSTGTYYTFLKNGSTVIRFRDEAHNESSLPLQVRFMDEAKPAAELRKWIPSGAAGELQPPTEPTRTDILALFAFNKNIKSITLTNADGTPADSTAVTAVSNGKTATVRFTRNYGKTVLTFTDFSGSTETCELPAITAIDKEPLAVVRAEKNDDQPNADEVVYTVVLNKPAYLTCSYGSIDVLTDTHTVTFPANGSYMLSFADQAGNVLSYPIELRGSAGLADVTVPKVTIKAPMTRQEYDAYVAAGETLTPYRTVLTTEAEISADETVYIRVDNTLIGKAQANEVLIVPIDRNGVFKVSVIDEAGNCFLTDFEIDCIDRESPVITSRNGGVLQLPVGTTESDFLTKAMDGMTAADERDGNLTGQMTIEKSNDFSLQKAGLYTIVYRVADHLGNETTYKRKVQITQGQGMLLYVNGQSALEGDVKALPRGVRSAQITTSLDGTVPLKMLFKPGIQTKGTMKNDSVKFSGTLNVSTPGYYTVLIQTQDRESVLLYLYFSF